jgi:hypothetical protein
MVLISSPWSRIFRASKEGDHRKVRSLQKLALRSYANALLSVRRVTQINAGSNTPGVDTLVVKTPKARGELVDHIRSYQPWKARPARRVYIPKANGKMRPLGIPTIYDRVMQAIVKNALEPYWEARFEPASYGFRPGRSCHDAIAKIFSIAKRSRLRPVLQYLADDHRFDGSMAQRLKRRGAPQVLRNGDLPRSFHRSWLSGKHGGVGLTCGDRSTLGNEPYGLYPSHLAIVRRHRIRPGDVRRR